MSLYPLIPFWLIAAGFLLSAGASFFIFRRRNPAVAPWQHKLLLALRMASLLLVTLMLLCPGRMTEEKNLDKSHIVFLTDRSGSMGTRDLPDGQSRLEAAAAFLRRTSFKRLADYPRDDYTFASDTRRLSGPDSLPPSDASGGTDLKQALARIDKDIGLNRVSACVLISDGLDDSGFKGSETPVPIMSVQAGTDLSGARDLGIEPFKCPDKIAENETLNVDVPLLLQGYPDEKAVRFRVFVDGEEVHSASPLLRSGRIHTESVAVAVGKTGLHTLRFECDRLPDEVTHLNNRLERAIEVVTAQENIVAYFPLLNNSLRPLLREFMKEDEGAFTAVYRVSGETFRLTGRKVDEHFRQGLPPNADALKSVTCLILGAHNGDLLSPAESLVVEQYVSRGGTLICLGGSDAFGRLPPDSPLLRLLPVVTLDQSFTSGRFKVTPDPAASDAFTGQIKAIIQDNAADADFLLSGINAIKDLKPNARVALWAEDEKRQPLLAWHLYGRGKVVALLSNAFHQWGSPDKRDENFSRFWRQLIAFSKRVDDASDLLSVTLSKAEYVPQEPIAVHAVAALPATSEASSLTVRADLFGAGSNTPIGTYTFERQGDGYHAELPGLPAGRYTLRVLSQSGAESIRTRYKLVLVGDAMQESARIRSDREAFRRFSSEKHIFSLADSAALEDRLVDAVRKNIVQRESFLIFETPFFFLALLILLGAEWILRRRFNLF